MRPVRHLNPRYIWDRLLEKRFRASHPDLPWLEPTSITLLETILKPEDSGLEFGSGRSTLWFSARTKALTSVEHNPAWYEKVKAQLGELKRGNVDYNHIQADAYNDGIPEYARVSEKFPAESLNYVLIDGIHRDHCALLSLDKIAPGGILIIDNVHLYFPNTSRAPNSVPVRGQPASKMWADVYHRISSWRFIWTGNGVSDTAVFFKPAVRRTSSL